MKVHREGLFFIFLCLSLSISLLAETANPPKLKTTIINSEDFLPQANPLKIEGKIDQEMPLYPGQRFQAVMRIYYVGNVKMTREELPLLDLPGFEKQGSIIIRQGESQGYAYQEILQAYDAKEPGIYHVAPSIITGIIKHEQGGESKNEASLEAMTIEVASFPQNGRPPSFDGVLGPATIEVNLASSPILDEGDTLKLAIRILDSLQPSTVHLPDLSCQPGFDGFFHLNATPPVVEAHENSKSFVVEMRPVSASITKIPSIEFSYFDLMLKKYVVINSKEIPITVKPIDLPPLVDVLAPINKDWKTLLKNPPFPAINSAIPMDPPFLKGYEQYLEGEAAESVKRREQAFNIALEIFEEGIQHADRPELLAALHYNIGNVFFQLEHPAMAVYHYYLSMATGKAPEGLKKNLSLALKVLGVKQGVLNMSLSRSPFYYFTPLQGVIVEAATLRIGPGNEYPYLDRNLIFPGTLTDVYSASNDGEWLKVSGDGNRTGFIEYKKIRLIAE